MRIVGESWYHMPVQMRHDIAEAGEIDLFRRKQLAQQSLDRVDDAQQPRTIPLGEVRHFPRVIIQDDPAEAGMIRIANQHHASEAVVPKDFAPGLRAQRASGDR